VVVDNSSAFRMTEGVPLVIPEVRAPAAGGAPLWFSGPPLAAPAGPGGAAARPPAQRQRARGSNACAAAHSTPGPPTPGQPRRDGPHQAGRRRRHHRQPQLLHHHRAHGGDAPAPCRQGAAAGCLSPAGFLSLRWRARARAPRPALAQPGLARTAKQGSPHISEPPTHAPHPHPPPGEAHDRVHLPGGLRRRRGGDGGAAGADQGRAGGQGGQARDLPLPGLGGGGKGKRQPAGSLGKSSRLAGAHSSRARAGRFGEARQPRRAPPAASLSCS
jgi:hypothetical protein